MFVDIQIYGLDSSIRRSCTNLLPILAPGENPTATTTGDDIARHADAMTLSEYIKQKRKKNGLSQVELAERANVGLRFVRDLEQGKQTLRMDKVNDVLALFGECLGPVKNDLV